MRQPGPAVTITAHSPGIWAAGQVHPLGAHAYPLGWFSARQVAEMQTLPGLTVEVAGVRRVADAPRRASKPKG
jgi:hypothetical protein